MELGGIGRKRHRIVDRANAYVLFLLSSAIHHKLTISRAHTYTYTHTHTHIQIYKYKIDQDDNFDKKSKRNEGQYN
jgi:hypothetical protein